MTTRIRLHAWSAVGLIFLLAACGGSETPETAASSQPQALAAEVAAPAGANQAVLGTIEATIAGTAHTWYVVRGEISGEPYATALWYEPEPGELWVTIGGFDTPTPPLETFERGAAGQPASFGEYEGPLFNLMLDSDTNPQPFAVTFPAGNNASSLIYMARATTDDISGMYSVESGTLSVTRIERANGLIRAEGTFSGALENMGGGQPIPVTNGRFSVEGVPHLDQVSGSSLE